MGLYVYPFSEGNRDMKELLGGKGANLAEMTRLGLPVPPGFVISTKACLNYLDKGEEIMIELEEEIEENIQLLAQLTGKTFGGSNPLLLSVRSGAAISMPGMMDTVLNLGLNDTTVKILAELTGNWPFALDCYRRLIQMFGEVVLGIEAHWFSRYLDDYKKKKGIETDADLNREDLEMIVNTYKDIIERESGQEFPQSPQVQLLKSVEAVFQSWDNRRARVYRRAHNIPDDLGTAVNVQAMVFGNKGEQSGTGVLFTRDPASGEKRLYGEFLVNAQGEDVVAGVRTPRPIEALLDVFPAIYRELEILASKLESHYKDVQDVEFTIEDGTLYILQTRSGKRTPFAAVKIAVDLVKEGLLSKEEALMMIEPESLEKLLHRQVRLGDNYRILATGLPASPGAASGKVVFDPDEAEKMGEAGEKIILVTPETTPDDIHGVLVAQGLLTARGGMTSHAAVVARGMGKPAVCGCEAIRIDKAGDCFVVDGLRIFKEDTITINGTTGEVILGEAPMDDPQLSKETKELLGWADDIRGLKVRANADNKADAAKAIEFGAEGIGLCRTEHMFMGKNRVPIVQKLILGETREEKDEALEELLPLQEADFKEILETMGELPVNVRLLDPPLHEFLPNLLAMQEKIYMLENAEDTAGVKKAKELFRKTKNMSEANPMLGLRGCRLGIVLPELYEMQVAALIRAALDICRDGKNIYIEIMIPLVSEVNELEFVKARLLKVIEAEGGNCPNLHYKIGTMVELPRACLTADQIAREAEFFSFGTNDLTQTTYGFSRDDAEGKFLHTYLDEHILPANPFVTIDPHGVGRLIRIAVEEGRASRPDLSIGICGEHGGDPLSIEFCYDNGLDYVSCSPYRVPVSRLAAAQAKIKRETK